MELGVDALQDSSKPEKLVAASVFVAEMAQEQPGREPALRAAVFDGAGEVAPAIRRAAGTGAPLPGTWAAYAVKVRDASYRITDHDVSALRAAGCTEEEIFEVTVAAATGAALQRLDLGLRAMRGEP